MFRVEQRIVVLQCLFYFYLKILLSSKLRQKLTPCHFIDEKLCVVGSLERSLFLFL